MEIEKIFYLFAQFATYWDIALAVFVSFFIRRTPPDLRILIVLLWAIVVQDAFNWIFVGGNNLFMIPLGTLIDLVLFFWLYYRYMLARGQYRIVLLLLALLGIYPLILDFIKALEVSNVPVLMFYGSFYISILLVVFSVIYFLQAALLTNFKVQQKHMLINIMVFLGYSVSLLYMLSINFLINENVKIVSYFWILRSVIFIISTTVYAYLIWKHGRTPKHLH